ncbi:MAG: tetratricopeptide repeat protein [Acidobacteriota bacterium]|nr:tetratricopeptide repeat protein [Acidobacteriota bacterium]
MDQASWERSQSCFQRALELPEEDWEPFLLSALPDSPELRAAVLAMLAEDKRSSSLLDRGIESTVQSLLDRAPRFSVGQSVGPYRLERFLGEGGMGVVWLASRLDMDLPVAIKLLPSARLSPMRMRRFAREIRTLSRLSHPFIARIYDAGAMSDGTPWFAMEYVEGVDICEYCRLHTLSVKDRLRLFHAVCETVQFAHGQEIIHRDLKPSNILIRSDGSPRLLDFGIARQLQKSTDDDDKTQAELRLFTPLYAAPEWRSEGSFGFNTDVYSLGIILYELVTGQAPGSAAGEALAPPSRMIAARALVDASTRSLLLSGKSYWRDLDALCLHAIDPGPARRYPSVESLLRDLDHLLEGEPLEAHPDSWRYRAEKFILKNFRALAFSASALVLLLAGISFFTAKIAEQRNAARAEVARTQRVEQLLESLFTGGDKSAGPKRDLMATTLLDRGVKEIRMLEHDPDVEAQLDLTLGRAYQQLGRFDQADQLFRRTEELCQQAGSSQQLNLGRSRLAIGNLRIDQAKLQDAEPYIREGIEIERRQLPADHPEVVEAQVVLGRLHLERGEYSQAVSTLTLALHSIPATDFARRAKPLSLLGDAYFYLAKYPDAETMYEQALNCNLQVFGYWHPSVADNLKNMGLVQAEFGRYREAEKRYQQALQISRAWYGPDHPDTADYMSYVADSYYWQNRIQEASVLLKDALDIMVKNYGEDHPRVALVLNQSGMVAHEQGNLKEAEKDYKRAAQIYRNIYGENHHMFAAAMGNLGSIYLVEGKLGEAEAACRRAIAVCAATQSPTAVNTADNRIRLGRVLLREKRYAAAEAESMAGYQILTHNPGANSSFLARAREDLAAEYAAMGKPDRAEEYRKLLQSSSAQ